MRPRAPAQRGDDRAWIRAALADYERPLLSYAWRLCGDLERARDVVQEAFLRLCKQDRDEVAAHLCEWLYRVTRNCAIDQHRKESRMSLLSEEEAAVQPASAPPPGAALETGEEVTRVIESMRSLPESQQEVLRLKFQHGLSYKEIAGVTEKSIGTVSWLIHAGLKSLRGRLSGEAPKGAEA